MVGVVGATALAGCTQAEIGADDDPTGDGGSADDGSGGGDGGADGAVAEPGLRERLAEPTAFAIADRPGGSRLHLVAVSLGDGVTADVELEVLGGVVTLSIDGDDRVRFHDLAVTTDDVTVSPVIVPPDGLALTDLTMELAAPASAQVGSPGADDAVAAGAELSVDMKWAVEVEHGVVDLAPIRLRALAFDVSVVEEASGALTAHLTASHPEQFWSWAGIFELRDLSIDLAARAEP